MVYWTTLVCAHVTLCAAYTHDDAFLSSSRPGCSFQPEATLKKSQYHLVSIPEARWVFQRHLLVLIPFRSIRDSRLRSRSSCSDTASRLRTSQLMRDGARPLHRKLTPASIPTSQGHLWLMILAVSWESLFTIVDDEGKRW